MTDTTVKEGIPMTAKREREDAVLILVAALNAIADPANPGNASMCECDHDTEDCCANADFYCPQCIAGLALLKYGVAMKVGRVS